MQKKPIVLGAVALVLVLVIALAVVFVPRLFSKPAGAGVPTPTTIVISDKAATAVEGAAASQNQSATATGAAGDRSADAAATPAAKDAASKDAAGKATATPAPRPPVSGDFPAGTGGVEASLVKLGNFREGPGTDYDILQVLDADTPVRLIGLNPSLQWAHVILSSGEKGWVYLGNLNVGDDLTKVPIDLH